MVEDSTKSKLLNFLNLIKEYINTFITNESTQNTSKGNSKIMKFPTENYPNDLLIFSITLIVIILIIWAVIDLIRYISFPYSLKKLKNLHDAISKNDTHRALSLLDPQLINIPLDSDGFTPFLRACLNGNAILVKTMLAMGADRKAMTRNHENAFYLAAFHCVCNITNKDATCIHDLYHAGVNINVPNAHGLSAVQMAAVFGHARLVQWLISKGVDLDIRPRIEDIAITNGYTEIAAMIEKRIQNRSPSRTPPFCLNE